MKVGLRERLGISRCLADINIDDVEAKRLGGMAAVAPSADGNTSEFD